jgi:poly(hydroxyalkanoate) depolymerase family esterase
VRSGSLLILTALALAGCACALAPGAARAASPGPGALERGTYPGGYSYLLYVPTSYDAARPAPLFVMVHGCTTTAEQQMYANEVNALAERKGFVVLYPDADPAGRLVRCWRFAAFAGFPADQRRGSADPAAIAGMTRRVVARLGLDPERVYVAGMSSGAAMADILGATYPDVFAAIAMNAGCAYRAGVCVASPPFRRSAKLGREAYRAMGRFARVVPVLVMHGDEDGTISPRHASQVVKQWLLTDRRAAGGRGPRPFGRRPASTLTVTAPGLYPATVQSYRDRQGCLLIERWTIHGMDHFWPGGTADPAYARFTDPRGPSGARLAWRFFARYRRSTTGPPCAEDQQPSR